MGMHEGSPHQTVTDNHTQRVNDVANLFLIYSHSVTDLFMDTVLTRNIELELGLFQFSVVCFRPEYSRETT